MIKISVQKLISFDCAITLFKTVVHLFLDNRIETR